MADIKIIPSVLTADLMHLGRDVQALTEAGCDCIQWDVMDGTYVPNMTFGPDTIRAAREYTDVPFEAHLMVMHPETMLSTWINAGCETIIIHPETTHHPHRVYQTIKSLGGRVGVALSPATPVEHLTDCLDLVDLIVVMTVNPGFGGQAYIDTLGPKIARLRAMVQASGRDIDIECDGGIGPTTIEHAAGHGANAFIAGSSLWRFPDFKTGIDSLRELAVTAYAHPV